MIDLKQKEFAEWQERNFGKADVSDMILGMSEEVGEMAHWYLKGKQGIRGVRPEVATDKIIDAFADTVVFGLQAMSSLGIDAEWHLKRIFAEVLSRDWKSNPDGNGYSQHKK